ncbi:MAG: DUF5660 domain-containing protein [Patescibacteria group bacterium]|nr:DUF5660 domain-containing protein [Patescibacteria group bacterium]
MATNRSHTPLRRQNSPEIEENPQTLGGIASSFVNEAASSVAKFGGDFFDQLFGREPKSPEREWVDEQEKQQTFQPIRRERVTLFSLREQRERQEIQQIKELLKQIKEEIKQIKKADQSLQQELVGAEKLVAETDPKAGIYHLRFLEIVLKLLQSVRSKIGESSAWLHAMKGKPKRGSAFAVRSKKQGTQYSMSQELSSARSVQ